MRESITYKMIPLPPRDNMNDILINVGPRNFLTNVSSNGYYGYQPQLHMQNNKQVFVNYDQETSAKSNTMEVQYTCFEENCETAHSRKRRCSCDEMVEFKKRRQNNEYLAQNIDESTNLTSAKQMQSSALQKAVHLRKPTHNIPDVPRCMMEREILDSSQRDKERRVMEDILRETHGVNMYHWLQNEDYL